MEQNDCRGFTAQGEKLHVLCHKDINEQQKKRRRDKQVTYIQALPVQTVVSMAPMQYKQIVKWFPEVSDHLQKLYQRHSRGSDMKLIFSLKIIVNANKIILNCSGKYYLKKCSIDYQHYFSNLNNFPIGIKFSIEFITSCMPGYRNIHWSEL